MIFKIPTVASATWAVIVLLLTQRKMRVKMGSYEPTEIAAICHHLNMTLSQIS